MVIILELNDVVYRWNIFSNHLQDEETFTGTNLLFSFFTSISKSLVDGVHIIPLLIHFYKYFASGYPKTWRESPSWPLETGLQVRNIVLVSLCVISVVIVVGTA